MGTALSGEAAQQSADKRVALDDHALDQLFRTARTYNVFRDEPISDDTIRQLYDLLKWGPTAFNAQPARYVFVRSPEAKAKLAPALSSGNRDKTLAAPLTVIVAADTRFHDHLPSQFPSYDARPLFENTPGLIEPTIQRNSSLQGAYLILAARALGLDAGPMSGFNADLLNQAFFPDGRRKANFLINLGYGTTEKLFPRNPRLDFDEVARIE
jgi:3-hydroxypropanoate dehydrogenase